MPPRFFVEQPVAADIVELVDTEAHHLLHVLRAKTGDLVTLFDGTGREFEGQVGRLRRSTVELHILSQRSVDRESPRRLVIGVALPKGDRQRWLVEKLVELGVAECVPLETSRGVAQPEGGTLEKLRRAVIEASKQCGRNRLMAIAAPLAWSHFVASAPDTAIRRVAHPRSFWPGPLPSGPPQSGPPQSGPPQSEPPQSGPPQSEPPQSEPPQSEPPQSGPVFEGETLGAFVETVRSSDAERAVYAAVGPEGGFSADEIAVALAAGWRLVSLGGRVLRIETAAMTLATSVVAAVDAT